jgi:hypothetical protein
LSGGEVLQHRDTINPTKATITVKTAIPQAAPPSMSIELAAALLFLMTSIAKISAVIKKLSTARTI